MLLSNLFRRMSYKQLMAQAKALFGNFDYKAMWKAVTADGYFIKHVKCWLFFCAKRSLRGQQAIAAARGFGILSRDYVLRQYVTAGLREHLMALADKYPALSIKTMDQAVVTIYNEIRDWLGKFVYRKMRFVYQSQGLTAHDMQMEVFAKGVQALYQMYPRVESRLHALNIVKSAAHNFGINMIKAATTGSRSRLTKEADNTFSSRVISIHDLPESVGAALVAEEQRETKDAWVDIQQLFMRLGNPISLHHLLYENAAASQLSLEQRLFALLCGFDDKEFTKWLQDQRKLRTPGKTCSDYLDNLDTDKALTLACSFLQMPMKCGREVLDNWRAHLSAYAPA